MKVQVTSEIGQLRSVLVHTPGPELFAVTPRTREDFLYDDIIEAETARREHQRLIAILERFAKVYQVRDLLEDVLKQPEVRDLFVHETMDIVPSEPLARTITELEPGRRVAFETSGKAGVVRHWLEVGPGAHGATITKGMEFVKMSPLSRIASPGIRLNVPRALTKDLERIKARLESAG